MVDALDTLYIMELQEEFQEAKDWVEKNFDLNVVSQSLNMFLLAAETAWHVWDPGVLTLGSSQTKACRPSRSKLRIGNWCSSVKYQERAHPHLTFAAHFSRQRSSGFPSPCPICLSVCLFILFV